MAKKDVIGVDAVEASVPDPKPAVEKSADGSLQGRGGDKSYLVTVLGKDVPAPAVVTGCCDESEAARVYFASNGAENTKLRWKVTPV